MKKRTPSPLRGTSPQAGEEGGGSEANGGVQSKFIKFKIKPWID